MSPYQQVQASLAARGARLKTGFGHWALDPEKARFSGENDTPVVEFREKGISPYIAPIPAVIVGVLFAHLLMSKGAHR